MEGSWFDPSNPVPGPGCGPRPDLAADLAGVADTADLVLVMGCGLAGRSGDTVAELAAQVLSSTK